MEKKKMAGLAVIGGFCFGTLYSELFKVKSSRTSFYDEFKSVKPFRQESLTKKERAIVDELKGTQGHACKL